MSAPSGPGGASSPVEVGWAITTLARRSSAVLRFRVGLFLMVAGSGLLAFAATEAWGDEWLWLVGAYAVMALAVSVAALLRGPGHADVTRAWAILRAATEDASRGPGG